MVESNLSPKRRFFNDYCRYINPAYKEMFFTSRIEIYIYGLQKIKNLHANESSFYTRQAFYYYTVFNELRYKVNTFYIVTQ